MTIIQIFSTHSVETKECCGRLLAFEVATQNGVDCSSWIDVTDWTLTQIKHWLGY